ncbi:hypothetical protein N7457_009784 [Penicillium paradoxum]|uniref:uncharacterized protein n=1 Tax=Penicillium paradoxum TaxID=176176 RepID=UPI002548B5A2|nr:uncharacterized protein N7457_009784 [Penicillium paradoxum]KAJ5774888.1 hypothetical protein N7457_009784 [Penicillium paradoxum]
MSDTMQQATNASMSPEIQSVADLIKRGKATRIVVLTGAGISTGAGIPDFRSPDTGLYDRLAPLKLPYPEAIFHINYFSHTPEPFYAIARARHPGNIKPTMTHAFLALCWNPPEKILSTHGNWKSQHCYKCKAHYPDDLMKKAIGAGEVPYCLEADCGGAVKPDVVFFGQALPAEFEEKEKEVLEADLMLVMGTSLRVAPTSRLPGLVKDGVPRVLINNEKTGYIGNQDQDVCIIGSCDDIVRRLADALGWLEELEGLWEETVAAKGDEDIFIGGPSLDECIENLANSMKDKMKVSDGHRRMLENHLNDKFGQIIKKPAIP